MTDSKNLVSPTLNTLRMAVEARDTTALENFWQQCSQKGTPLIETLPNNNHLMLVTFLWKAIEPTEHVTLISDVVGGTQFPIAAMEHLTDTDMWYKTYQIKSDTRTIYTFSPNSPLAHVKTSDDWWQFWRILFEPKYYQPDPFNPLQTHEGDSILHMPDATPERWCQPRSGVEQGELSQQTISSKHLNNERTIWVYTPPDYQASGDRYPCLWLLDGGSYLGLPLPTMLDNLIAEGTIPPIVAVLIDNAEGVIHETELLGNPDFNQFLAAELIPDIRQKFYLSDDPAANVIGGMSAGGVAAAYAALNYPNIFGRVLSQGGHFCGRQREEIDGSEGWLMAEFARRERQPIQFHLDIGYLDTFYPNNAATNDWVANRHMCDVLIAKGYTVDFVEFSGGHDFAGWQIVLPDALIWAFAKSNQI